MRKRENRFLQTAKNIDIFLILATISLSLYGIIAVSSASGYLNDDGHSVTIQTVATVGGAVAMIIIAFVDYYKLFRRYWWLITPFSLLFLFLPVAVHGFGNNENWITIPIINYDLQPSEFVKITFIIAFAFHLSVLKDNDAINDFKNVLTLLLHGGAVLALLLVEGDLGATIMYLGIMLIMCFVAKLSILYYLGFLFACAFLSPFLWGFLKDYQKVRILVGFSPEQDPEGSGYQVLQTMKAISNGGIYGMGYKQGTITQDPVKSVLPARHTDMILSAVGEEFGFIGILLFFVLIFFLIVRILIIAKNCNNICGSYICTGVAAVFFVQTLENVGMCLGMLPVIGITLPFMSYGGSSVFALYLCIGVVLSVGAHQNTSRMKIEQNINPLARDGDSL